MKKIWSLLISTLIASLFLPFNSAGQETRPAPALAELSEYRIKIGDTLQVSVDEHPELSKTVVVDGKGRISLPRIHTMKASGLSVMELITTIRQTLQPKIENPRVSVCVGCRMTPGRPGEMRDVVEPSRIQAKNK
jgi:protein involved in polysaccharide export with SLBB domain